MLGFVWATSFARMPTVICTSRASLDTAFVRLPGLTTLSDRLGDTFRWRSENVSTTEVANILGEVLDEANVYGVLGTWPLFTLDMLTLTCHKVPNSEGRAGCAAIPAGQPIDFIKLGKHVTAKLPNYARPLFLRVVKSMETTSTNKQQKVQLRTEGIDPEVVKDPM